MACGARVLFVAALTTHVAASQPVPDAAQVLADMRQALGGEALKAIETFSVKGSLGRGLGRMTMDVTVEWAGILPDRFIEERQFPSSTITSGFNGEALIRSFKGTSGGRGRSPVAGEQPKLSEAIRQTMMILAKQHFSRLTVGMFGITPVYPLDATYISREMLDGKPVHLLELRGPDDYVARLCVDVSSHLPRMISWMGRALTLTAPLLAAVRDPPVVEHRIYFGDYEKRDGLNWPHHLTEVVGKITVGEIRLGKFQINPKLDPQRFDPAR